MRIIYEQHPLKSKVELTEADLVSMRAKLKLEEVYNAIFDAYYKADDLAKVKESLEDLINSEEDPESKINKRVEQLMSYYVDELVLGYEHSGDCTKVCCSCTKCAAEDSLGINTLAGLKGLHYITGAFGKDTTLDEAIESLSKEAEYTEEWHKPHIERWTKERKAALESLIWYKDKYFSE
jgi:hypothetical protein